MHRRCVAVAAAALAAAMIAPAGASANPILMPTLQKEISKEKAILAPHVLAPAGSLTLPAPPCPENGMLPAPFSNCGLPEFPATTLPYPGNMSYWGGHVQVTPKVYVVYWGWGEPGAFPARQPCSSQTITEGSVSATLACDPDGAGKRMADFVSQLGGTQWANTTTQYSQKDAAGQQQFITNPSNQLGGIWVDDTNDITGLSKTSSSNSPGATNT
jgi:hypothetical protein